MSRLFADLESVLKQMLVEHRLMVGSLEAQQAAMKKLDLPAIGVAAREQEACRLRVVSMETRRRAITDQLSRELRVQGPLTLSRLAELHPPGARGLMALRIELRAAIEEVRSRAFVAARVAHAVLGHLNTMVRLFSGAVEKAGLYTRSGTARVSSRIGMMEAIG